jgi:hypothetical protein
MGIVNSTFNDKSDPLTKLQKALAALSKAEPEASFRDKNKRDLIDRASLEMFISDYAQSQQNPQLFNKWLQIDTKFEKALREYKSDVQMLISGVTQLGQAQQMVAEPTNMPSPAPEPSPQASQQGAPPLPVNRQ